MNFHTISTTAAVAATAINSALLTRLLRSRRRPQPIGELPLDEQTLHDIDRIATEWGANWNSPAAKRVAYDYMSDAATAIRRSAPRRPADVTGTTEPLISADLLRSTDKRKD